MSNPEKTGRTQDENWSLAWQFARCELRHSVMRFRIFLAALMLGVAAIGAVGSVAESMRSGIADNGRMLLGGDFELSSLHVAPDNELLEKVRQTASLSEIIQMRAMLGTETGTEHAAIRKLVELKAVDEAYPLVGIVELSPPQTLKQALADRGAVVAPALLRATGLSIGDKAQLGEITITVRGVLDSEPDQTISFVSFGPRLMVSTATLNESGLRQEGAFITYRNRAVVRQASSQLEDIITNWTRLLKTHISGCGPQIQQQAALTDLLSGQNGF